MSRQTVTIDDVQLTREQVERALATLNAPPTFKAGDIVICNGNPEYRRLVLGLGSNIAGVLDRRYGAEPAGIYRVTDGSETYTWYAENMMKVGTLRDR